MFALCVVAKKGSTDCWHDVACHNKLRTESKEKKSIGRRKEEVKKMVDRDWLDLNKDLSFVDSQVLSQGMCFFLGVCLYC